ncbi:hypothetical protein OK351_08495 [Glutamicibacter sp. MNS18]|uniref:hypothetical protein n=1 Tax=Glutamicibacter sp. MNS18 TaxID=2989817 RepID=UPI0022362C20|nr:hypothetical protein [Glutamicibacter sp. MNS18]MCW4465541.1 hypothetical protein [Glutamicibacter sp. MNS18]
MRNPKRNLTLTAMLISAGFLVTGCSGNQSPEPSTPPIASEQSPTVTESPS